MPQAKVLEYYVALSLVDHLIETCPDSIRKLLNLKGRIALVSPSDIVVLCKEFRLPDANRLVRKFISNRFQRACAPQ